MGKRGHMKKFLFSIFIALIVSCRLYALDMTTGVAAWYASSEQYYTQKPQSGSGLVHDSLVKSKPAFLYGPTLSVKLNSDFNITFVFLYGTFDTEKNTGAGGLMSKSKYQRSDSDLALNYRLNNYFKVFTGFKLLTYHITPTKYDGMSFRITNMQPHVSYGLGSGLSAAIPLIDNLFCLGTVSGLYLLGADKVQMEELPGNNPRNLKNKYNEYGINTTLSLAYYIAPASTVISLGGRFQYLKAEYKQNPICLDAITFAIYGVTMTATYTFSL